MFIGLRQFRFVIISSLVFAVVGCGHKQHTSPSHKVSSASLSLSTLSPFTPNSQASVQSTDFKTELSQALGAQAGGSVYSQQSLTITANGIGSGLHNFNISGQDLQITGVRECITKFSGPGDAQRSCVVHVQPISSTAVDSTETTSLHATADDSDSHLVFAQQMVIIKAKTQPKPGALGITVAPATDFNFTKENLVNHLQVSLVNCMPRQAYTLSLANKQSSSSSSWLELARNSTTVTCGAAGSVKNQPISLQVSAPVPTTNSSVSFNLKAQGSSQDPSQGQQVLSAQLHASWTVEPPAKTKLTLMVTDTATPPHSGTQDDPIPLATAAATAVNLTLTCDPSSSANSYPLNISLPADTALSITDKDGGASVPTSIQCGAANPISIKVSIALGKTLQPTDKLSIDINKQGAAGSKSSANAVIQAVYFKAPVKPAGYMINVYDYHSLQDPQSYNFTQDFSSCVTTPTHEVGAFMGNKANYYPVSGALLNSHNGLSWGGAGSMQSVNTFISGINSGSYPGLDNLSSAENNASSMIDLDIENNTNPVQALLDQDTESDADNDNSPLYEAVKALSKHHVVTITAQYQIAPNINLDLSACRVQGDKKCLKGLQLMLDMPNVYLQPMDYLADWKTSLEPLISWLNTGKERNHYNSKILVGLDPAERTGKSGGSVQTHTMVAAMIKQDKLGGAFIWEVNQGGCKDYNDLSQDLKS